MCVAISGKLIEIDDTKGKVELNGNILPVELGMVNAKIGDYVLVHAGCAISVLRKGEQEELDELYDLLREVIDEERG